MIEVKLPDIVRAEADDWWIVIFFIVAVFKVIQFIFKAKKNTAKNAPPDSEAENARDELEDFFSGLTQAVQKKAAPDQTPESLPPSIAVRLENEASVTPQVHAAVQQRITPQPAPQKQHYDASNVSDTYKNKENDLSFIAQPHSTPGQWKKVKPDRPAKRKVTFHPEKVDIQEREVKPERLFQAAPLLSKKTTAKTSRLVAFRTRRDLKSALVSREVLGTPRALTPYGAERQL